MSMSGMDEVFALMEQKIQQITKEVSLHIAMVTNETIFYANKYVPVESGELKESGQMYLEPMKGTVTYGTDHCWYVELGTHKMKAQPFLYRAFKREGRVLKSLCKETLNNL